MDTIWTIYQIKNLSKQKSYIGATKNLRLRLNQHRCINKHFFVDEYEILLLASCLSKKDASFCEKILVSFFQTNDPQKGWNKTEGGYDCYKHSEKQRLALILRNKKNKGKDNPMYGRKQSEKTKQLMSQQALDRYKLYGSPLKDVPKKPESVAKQRKNLLKYYEDNPSARIGHKHTPETCAKLSEAQRRRAARGDKPFLDKKHSLETRKKMSLAKKGKTPIVVNSIKKPVKNLDTGKIYESAREASRDINIHFSAISNCCKKKVRVAGGFQWLFV